MQFRNDIQGLRALAFLVVLVFHMNAAWLPGGFLGVDLFFVISGYLMTTLTLSDIQKGRFSFYSFYIKRLKRLVPAYLFLLLAVAVGVYSLYLYTDILKFQNAFQSALGFYSNHFFASGDSYFGAKLSENPLLHTWSLAVEMQFYLLLPIVIYWFRNYMKFIYPIVAVVLAALATYFIIYNDGHSDMYFSLWARIPEFLVGGCYALFFKNGLKFKGWKNEVFTWGSLTLLGVCFFTITESSVFPGLLALVPCLLGANLLVSSESGVNRLFSSKVLVKIGEWSYSLYLWHWPVLAFFRYKTDSYELSAEHLFYAIVLTFILALVSFYGIENALRKSTTKTIALVSLPMLVGLGFITWKLPEFSTSKKLPDLYTQPYFGTKSHNVGKVQRLGDRSRKDSILLIGDSHALMIKPFLDKLGKKHHFSFETTTNDGIPALPEVLKSEMKPSDLNFYKNSRRLVGINKDLIQRNRIIFINSTSFVRYPSLMKAVENLCKNLKPNQKLVLVRSFPTISKNPLRLNSGIARTSDEGIDIHFKEDNQAFIERLDKTYDNVYSYDLTKSKVFKTPGYINDTVAYYNATHLNTYGSYKLADDLELDLIHFLNSLR